MPEAPPQTGGSVWMRKVGPMPFWAWGAIGIAVAVIIRVWQQNKANAASQQQTSSTPDTTPPMVDQDYITIINPVATAPEEPPGQGRHGPPQGDQDHHKPKPVPTPKPPHREHDRDVPSKPGTPKPKPKSDNDADNRPAPAPAPAPRPAPKPAPKPAGQFVTVAKWTAKNAPWNSTVSGIASHFKIKSWQTVWNDPHNAALKARRKQPQLIQPGDRVWVPA